MRTCHMPAACSSDLDAIARLGGRLHGLNSCYYFANAEVVHVEFAAERIGFPHQCPFTPENRVFVWTKRRVVGRGVRSLNKYHPVRAVRNY